MDIAGSDVICFIDNEAAVCACVRGTSRESDVADFALAIHWLLMRYNIRAWFEWVDSDSNCSDGLSRAGVSDAWTQKQGWALRESEGPSRSALLEHESLALDIGGCES